MSAAFRPNALVSNDGTIIALMRVESIGQVSKEEDAVIDKLKDDLTFTVTMVSGNKHTISIKEIVKAYKKNCHFDDDMYDIYLAILDRWINLLGS